MNALKKKINKKILYAILYQYLAAVVITLIMLLYQKNFKTLGIINGIQVAGSVLIVAGWFVFINDFGLFDVAIFGVKQFFMGLTGKKMDKKLYEIRATRKKMPKYLYLTLWINGLLIIIISFIIYFNINI